MTPVLYVTTVDVFMYYFLATNKVDPEERRKQLIAEATETDGATDQPVMQRNYAENRHLMVAWFTIIVYTGQPLLREESHEFQLHQP